MGLYSFDGNETRCSVVKNGDGTRSSRSSARSCLLTLQMVHELHVARKLAFSEPRACHAVQV